MALSGKVAPDSSKEVLQGAQVHRPVLYHLLLIRVSVLKPPKQDQLTREVEVVEIVILDHLKLLLS